MMSVHSFGISRPNAPATSEKIVAGTVSKARGRLPLALWDRRFAYVSQTAQAWGEAFAYWRGHRVVLLDGTCVSMPDEPALFEAFGVNTGRHGKGKYPLARVATLCLAGTMTMIAYALGGYRQGEWALALSILDTLRTGDLLIADRHFAAAHYYHKFQFLRVEFLTRAHQRLIVSRIKRVQATPCRSGNRHSGLSLVSAGFFTGNPGIHSVSPAKRPPASRAVQHPVGGELPSGLLGVLCAPGTR